VENLFTFTDKASRRFESAKSFEGNLLCEPTIIHLHQQYQFNQLADLTTVCQLVHQKIVHIHAV